MVNQQIEILIVEDNHDDAHFISRGLTQLNLDKKSLRVDSGEDALDFIFTKDKHSDRLTANLLKLILLDLKLPQVNGLEILKQIKTDERTRFIPVVILTSSQEQADQVSAYQLGANSYMVKPVMFESFIKELEHVVKYWMFLNQSAQNNN